MKWIIKPMLPFGIMSMTVLGGCTCKEDKPCTDVTDGSSHIRVGKPL